MKNKLFFQAAKLHVRCNVRFVKCYILVSLLILVNGNIQTKNSRQKKSSWPPNLELVCQRGLSSFNK